MAACKITLRDHLSVGASKSGIAGGFRYMPTMANGEPFAYPSRLTRGLKRADVHKRVISTAAIVSRDAFSLGQMVSNLLGSSALREPRGCCDGGWFQYIDPS